MKLLRDLLGEAAKNFKEPVKVVKVSAPKHGGKQGDVKNKSAEAATKENPKSLKGVDTKDKPFVKGQRFTQWLSGNMIHSVPSQGK